ncbi:MAG: hypothetical protein WD044_14335 [Dongiaceae bacterium]
MNLDVARRLDRAGLQEKAGRLAFETRNFIDGRFVDARNGRIIRRDISKCARHQKAI